MLRRRHAPQDRLTLTLAMTRLKWGKKRPTVPSRFLFELQGQADRAPTAAARRADAPAPVTRKSSPPTRAAGASAVPRREVPNAIR